MVQVDGIYELVALVTDLFPVFVILSLIGLFMILLARMLGGGSGIADKFNLGKKLKIVGLPVAFLLMLITVTPVNGAVAITIDSNVIFGGSIATIKATGLTTSTEYTIYATNNAETFSNVTFTSTGTTQFVPVPIPDEDDLAFTLTISASTSGIANAVGPNATYFVALTEVDGFLPTDMFLNLLVPLLLLLILVGIVVSIAGSKRGK